MLTIEIETRNSSFERYVQVLGQGADLIQNLSDAVYRRRDADGQGSVGSHFRHIVEFVFRLCAGISIGKVDYNRRDRDAVIEQDRAYAAGEFKRAISLLRNLPKNIENKQILLRLEDTAAGDCDGESETDWCISSVLRELEFLQSHTIHHYALIAEKLAAQGVRVEKDFGVSPSTLRFWEKGQKREKAMCIGK